MKISILLPYKENFSPSYPGAVSLFVKDTAALSKYKKNLIVYGNTNYKKKFPIKYSNIPLSNFRFKNKEQKTSRSQINSVKNLKKQYTSR